MASIASVYVDILPAAGKIAASNPLMEWTSRLTTRSAATDGTPLTAEQVAAAAASAGTPVPGL